MRALLLTILIAGLLILLTLPAIAEDTEAEATTDAGLEAMQKLSDLVGRWEGAGWMQRGPGEPDKTLSTETVESRLGGRILVVEGLHHAQEDPSQVVHHALGVISYDEAAGHYKFRTYLANGRGGEHEMRLEGDDILWFIETPQGKIRYTIRIEDGMWHEIGEMSRDGETWRKFFGMDLQKM